MAPLAPLGLSPVRSEVSALFTRRRVTMSSLTLAGPSEVKCWTVPLKNSVVGRGRSEGERRLRA